MLTERTCVLRILFQFFLRSLAYRGRQIIALKESARIEMIWAFVFQHWHGDISAALVIFGLLLNVYEGMDFVVLFTGNQLDSS
jgi:hypothetical protein